MRNRKELLYTGNLICCLLFFSVGNFAQTTDPTPTPENEAEKKLEAEINLLTKEKTRLGLLKDIRDSQTPAGVNPLNGDRTGVKDLFMEVEMQAYKAMGEVTNKIACDVKIKAPSAKNIVIYRAEDYNQWRNYRLMQPVLDQQLNDLKSRYQSYLDVAKDNNAKPAGIPGLGLLSDATSALKAFIGLVAFLRSDLEFSSKTVSIDETALHASMLKSFRGIYPSKEVNICKEITENKELKLYDPSLFSPTTDSGGNLISPMLDQIKNLFLLKAKAEVAVRTYDLLLAEIETAKKAEAEAKGVVTATKVIISTNPSLIAQLDDQIKQTTDPERKKDLIIARDAANKKYEAAKLNLPTQEQDVKDLAAIRAGLEGQVSDKLKITIAELRQANTDFNQFLAGFTKLDSTTGTSPLAQYVKSENLDLVLKQDDTFWIQLKPVKAGGNNLTEKNLIRYLIGPKVTFSGGFIAEYMLGNKKGEVILSNTDGKYLKYVKADKIQQ